MLLRTLVTEIIDQKAAQEFVKFVAKFLQLKTLPRRVVLSNDPEFPKDNLTFGHYTPMTDEIVVYKGNRNIVDVYRTLAHELVHHKQREENKPLDGSTGSSTEDEANATAGIIMRKFRHMHPEIYAED